MGAFTIGNNSFKSASYIFSKVKRDLHSFDSGNLMDEGEFPKYVKEVNRLLGIAVYKDNDAVAEVRNYKAQLPEDFLSLHAAYKCTPVFNEPKTNIYQQGSPISVYNDVTWELLQDGKNCQIECPETKILESITIRQFVKEQQVTISMTNPILLRLSPNVGKDICDGCANVLASSPQEISIRDNRIFTNFNNDCIYLQYYSLPTDDDGVPLILDNEKVEKTIEWYIKFQLFLNWWHNNEVGDIERRMRDAEMRYENAYAEAKHEMKFPTFAGMVNHARTKRSTNLLNIFRQLK